MKDISPLYSKTSYEKCNDSSPLNNHGNKTKSNEGMSLLSMWKIEGRQKTVGDVVVGKTSPKSKVSPLKKKVSPKNHVKKKIKVELNVSSVGHEDLGYCPNCQMPFTALIKQSSSWHIAECIDFDFQHLKECSSGAACSSTIPSHYMKYTHYGLAKARSRSSKSPKNSPPNKKSSSPNNLGTVKQETSTSPSNLGKVKQETFTSPSNLGKVKQQTFSPPTTQFKNSSPKPVAVSVSNGLSLKKYDDFGSVNTSDDAMKCSSPSKFLNFSKSTNLNISPESHLGQTKKECSPDRISNETKNSVSPCSVPSLTRHSSNINSTESDCGKCFQEFKMPTIMSSMCSKTFSLGNISTPETIKNHHRMQEEHSNEKKSNNQNENVTCDVAETISPSCDNQLCFDDNESDREIEGELGSNFAASSTCAVPSVSSNHEDITADVQRNIKHMQLNGNISSCANHAVSISGIKVSDGNLNDNITLQSPVLKKRKLDSLHSNTAGSDNAYVNESQNSMFDIRSAADDWFSGDNFNADGATESVKNSGVRFDSDDEIFFFEDASVVNKKNIVQTVLSKASSESDSSFNLALSQIKLEKQSPKKKIRSSLHVKSPNRAEKDELTSPKKRQTTLMSFFKSSSIKEENIAKIKLAESTNAVNNYELQQNKFEKDAGKNKTFHIEQQGQNNYARPVKKCPFYKKIPDTTFCVDAFSYGSIPGIQHYFLSHFHYDHYMGLTKNFQHPVYCSVVTANLVSLKIRLPQKYIHTLKLNETVVIDCMQVTLLDANHCPGSVMFLFGFPDGRFILHTGDFRAIPDMELYPSLKNCIIERLYLDTTYCNPTYDFPSQDDVLELMTSLVVPRMKINAKVLVACGSYTIGKERAFMAIAEAINCKIWAEKVKLNILKCIEDERISSRLVTNANLAKVHVLPMQMIKISTLQQYLLKFPGTFDEIIGLKPTGWEHKSGGSNNIFSLKPICHGPVTIFGIPYSEHSSFSELKKFVQFLRPRNIVPTVNVGKASSRSQMQSCFKQWES